MYEEIRINETDFEVKVRKFTHGRFKTTFEDGATVRCSKNDTYDFEVGALIALMRTCGEEKTWKAIREIYKSGLDKMTNCTFSFLTQNLEKQEREEYQEAIKIFKEYKETERKTSNRDKLWDKYLSTDRVIVKVRRESINVFLKEAEERGIVWCTGAKPTEKTYWGHLEIPYIYMFLY